MANSKLHTSFGFPTTGQNAGFGGTAWTNPTNIQADANEAVCTVTVGIVSVLHVQDEEVSLIINGAVVGDDKSTGIDWTTVATDTLYGGPADVWGTAITRDDLYLPNTGLAFRSDFNTGVAHLSDRLEAVGWTWNPVIPENAVIIGIEALIKKRYFFSGRLGANGNTALRYVQLKAYYEVPGLDPHFSFP